MNSSIMTSFRGPAACAALYCLLALLCMGVASETQAKDVSMNTDMQHGLMRKKAHGDLDTVWKRLLDTLTAAKAPVFATVDHRANAQGAGLEMTGARVVIFGNPAVGTALMQAAPEAALDLPLKILVWESPDGVMLSWSDPAWIAGRYGAAPNLEVVAKMRGMLEKLTSAAAGS